MGRPIKKKWFTAKAGSTLGNLTIRVADDGAGGTVDEAIIKQVGTGVYETASGRYKLVEGGGDPHVSGDGLATLTHDDGVQGLRYVSKINQYRLSYFADNDGDTADDAQWRDHDDPMNIVGTFVPALTPEGAEVAAANVSQVLEVSEVKDAPKKLTKSKKAAIEDDATESDTE